MDADYGQPQLQRPAGYDETGAAEKPKKPLLKKMKDKAKAPVKKIKHKVAKKKNGGDDKATDDNLTGSPEPEEEEEEGYEEDDEEQEVDQGVHGPPAVRDAVADSRMRDNESVQGRQHLAGGEQGGIAGGLENLKGDTHEDPAAPGGVNTTGTGENKGSFPPTAGEEKDANPSLTDSFHRMAMSDKPQHENQGEALPTSKDVNTGGSHDQSSLASGEKTSRELPTQEHNPSDASAQPQSYTNKITTGAAGLASTAYGTAATAGSVLKEKVAGGPTARQGGTTGGERLSSEQQTDPSQQGYTQKVVAPVKDRATGLASTAYDKAAGAGAAAKEKVTGTTNTTSGEGQAGAKSAVAEKLKPGEEEKALSEQIAEMLQSKKDAASEKATQAKDISAEKAYQAKDVSGQKAGALRDRAYGAKDVGTQKATEQTGLAKEKANELKDKTVEAKDVGTDKASSTSTPYVEKIKGAVSSLFGSRASADTESQAAAEQASAEKTQSKPIQDQTA